MLVAQHVEHVGRSEFNSGRRKLAAEVVGSSTRHAPSRTPRIAAMPKTSVGVVSSAGPAGPAGADVVGDMARSLLGATGCFSNELPTPPTTAEWTASEGCLPYVYSLRDDVCTASCLPGFTGSGSFCVTCSINPAAQGDGDSYKWAETTASLKCTGEALVQHPEGVAAGARRIKLRAGRSPAPISCSC